MDFSKLQNQVAALLAPARTPAKKEAPETRRMTAEQFAEYADQQVAKAKDEADKGRRALSKQRLEALHAEVTRLSKFEYKPSELPTVTVYKDPDQLETTEREESIQGLGNSTPATQWTAKANQLAKQLSEAIGELSNRPTDKNEGGNVPAPAPEGQPSEPNQPSPAKPDGEEKPKDAPAGDPPKPSETQKSASDDWPRDLARAIRPHKRDKDPDYDWGRDAP